MKSKKQRILLNVFVFLFLSCGTAFAQTCYDPNYGYYTCDEDYQGQAFIAGAFLGLLAGSLANQGYYEGRRHHGDWDRHEGGGWHHGGGGRHH